MITDSRGLRVDMDRMCVGKRRYPDRRTAKRCGSPYGHRPYRCPICGRWHLTSRRPRP